MTTLTKTEAEAILERLADKTLSFGCRVLWENAFNDLRPQHLVSFELIVMGAHPDFPECVKLMHPLSHKVVDKGAYIPSDYFDEILGHPILIGDVLDKVDFGDCLKLLKLWAMCSSWDEQVGLTSSLQEIYNRLEWEMDVDPNPDNSNDQFTGFVKVAKPSPFADLFIFLKEIGL